MKSIQTLMLVMAAVLMSGTANVPTAHAAGGEHVEIERQSWPFSGIFGQYDRAQLQRGFQVYNDVCSACHGLERLAFRNLVQPGGPEFQEEAVKALAAEWPNQITDGPNDDGDMFQRPAKLTDPILGPFANEKAARAANGGAYPPDLSIIAKARNVERDPRWFVHPFLMLGDILTGYQEGGADYIYAMLTGYEEKPADVQLAPGMHYNTAFPGHQIAMPAILTAEAVEYQDGTKPTLSNHAKDVVAFLSWAADPSHDQRKQMGWIVILYLIVTTALLYLAKKSIWRNVKH